MVATPTNPAVSLTNPMFVGFLIVIACDVLFVAWFTLRRHAKRADARRARASMIGIALQEVACAVVGVAHRVPGTPIWPMPAWGAICVAFVASAVAIASVALCIAAVRTLGKQWTFVAEVSRGHELVTTGPYAIVRHPIYTGMTGLVIASALVVTRWWAIPVAVALQAAGTWVRVRSEERLLRETHGAAFDEYAGRVAAVVPGIR